METTTRLKDCQKIVFEGDKDFSSYEVDSTDVEICVSSEKSSTSSSKVLLTNLVEFGWETRYHYGNVLAVHISRRYLAYAVKAVGRGDEVIRLVNEVTGERVLLKGPRRTVRDLSFAHSRDRVVLGCIDSAGNVFIYSITQDAGMICKSILEVLRPQDTDRNDYHRLVWCPYIPDGDSEGSEADSDDGRDMAMLLATTQDKTVEVWNVDEIIARCGEHVELYDMRKRCQIIKDNLQPVIDISLSPDGANLATASLEGVVKFYNVSLGSKSSECLREWNPHDSKQMSSLFFLDNKRNPKSDEQFWKFVVTGACNNQEIKVWDCETWNCLQTIRFTNSGGEPPCLKAALDLESSYLLLSDINRKLLYIFLISKNATHTNPAYFYSVSLFPLIHPFLSYVVTDAAPRRFRPSSLLDEEKVTEITDEEEFRDDSEIIGVVIRAHLICARYLQKCCIAFKPEVADNVETTSQRSLSLDSLDFNPREHDDYEESRDTSASKRRNVPAIIGGPVLLTPAAFSTPVSHILSFPHSCISLFFSRQTQNK